MLTSTAYIIYTSIFVIKTFPRPSDDDDALQVYQFPHALNQICLCWWTSTLHAYQRLNVKIKNVFVRTAGGFHSKKYAFHPSRPKPKTLVFTNVRKKGKKRNRL